MLGITKLSTTSYHCQFDGTIERFNNQTLKQILRKQAACFASSGIGTCQGSSGPIITPHTTTCEKPSFLLFRVDCRSPTEVAFMPVTNVCPTNVEDCRKELMLSLSSASSHSRQQGNWQPRVSRRRKQDTRATMIGM